jgi:hypothetical protein
MSRTGSLVGVAVLLALVTADTSEAKTIWRVPTTIGYGGLGTAVGLLAVHGTGYDLDAFGTVALATGAGAILGITTGYMIGQGADDRLARGDTLSWRHRNAVRLGAILSMATLGAAVSAARPRPIVMRNGSHIEAYASDEALLRGAIAGAIGGVLLQWWLDDRLAPRTRVSVGLTPAGAVAVAATWRALPVHARRWRTAE